MQEEEKWLVGIDEAGRGSLVGELMICAYATKIKNISILKEMGVKDSKQLTPYKREELYNKIVKLGYFSIYPIKPIDLDKYNINLLEEKASLINIKNILTQLGSINFIEKIIIDKFGNLKILPKKLKELRYRGDLIVEEKADVNYPIVSAASIIAKVIRDKRLEILKSLYDIKGSGYPADPDTVDSVMELLNKGHRPDFIRYSWGTLEGTEFYKKKSKIVSKSLEEFMK
ncbi:MAG: ribonuclease HII [Caldisphaera sp.]|jgi:ribonuclease HII